MGLLRTDFGLSQEEAAAIVGNIGHECAGFKTFQEAKPMVPGSAGGYGWCQWTGPRRRAFEAYCSRNKLDPKSDKANYGFLFVELTGSEKGAIPKTKAAKATKDHDALYNKMVAFEASFERAGIKHYDSRYVYAKWALAAYRDAAAAGPIPGAPWVIKAPEKPAEPVVEPEAPTVPPDDEGVSVTLPKGFWASLVEAILSALRKPA